jgi:hypothetical protein
MTGASEMENRYYLLFQELSSQQGDKTKMTPAEMEEMDEIERIMRMVAEATETNPDYSTST